MQSNLSRPFSCVDVAKLMRSCGCQANELKIIIEPQPEVKRCEFPRLSGEHYSFSEYKPINRAVFYFTSGTRVESPVNGANRMNIVSLATLVHSENRSRVIYKSERCSNKTAIVHQNRSVLRDTRDCSSQDSASWSEGLR